VADDAAHQPPAVDSAPTGEAAPAPASPETALPEPPRGGVWFSRRDWLNLGGWAAFFTFFTTMLLGSLRYMFPRVLFEPPSEFDAGRIEDFSVGDVNTKFLNAQQVWIARSDTEVIALLAVCTHLGCTPRWLKSENKFKCPCHGSGFRGFTFRTSREGATGVGSPDLGKNFEGPAPRPLERLKVTLSDNHIIIDKGIKFLFEKGQWGDPEASLPIA